MINKLKKNINKNKYIYITFILSSIVISTIFIFQKIAPFGKNSMLDVDFYHQYGPLLNELYDRVKFGSSLIYSFNTGGGIPFYRNFLNYLSSPFNIILFLFRKENIVMAFSIIIALKVIVASCTMVYFLKKSFRNDNYLICIFGLLYAFSGYFCAYYWNIMWLDGMVFLPLIAYGINKIIDNKKPLTYIFSLSVMLFANYFIGYMICIFSVLYFICYFWYKKGFKIKEFIITGIYFAISSILAAGLVSFALIPLYYSLSSISATKDIFPTNKTSFKVINFLFNHITGVSRTVFSSDKLVLPNVYCGLVSIMLFTLLFFNKKINLKVKVIATIFIIFFLVSFNNTRLDFIWHAFHVPNDLPWRYSFIYVFGFVTLAYYSLTKIREMTFLKNSIISFIMILFLLLSLKLDFANITTEKVIICLILVLIYYLLYSLYNFKFVSSNILSKIFIFVVMFECFYGININWDIDHDISLFMSDKKDYEKLISEAKKDDNGLYRIEKTNYLTLNDGAWYNYYGISTFSSMAYENTSKLQRKLGLSGNNINSYYYRNYQTPIYNTMFNIRYILGDYIENDYYTKINEIQDYSITKYNYPSSLVYSVNKNIKSWTLVDYNPFYNQTNFAKYFTDKNIFEPVNVDSIFGGKITSSTFFYNSNGDFYYELDKPSTKLTLTINDVKNKNIYFYIAGSNISSFSVNNTYYSLTSDEYYIFDSGKIKDDNVEIIINFKNSDSGNLKFYAYTINDLAFKEFYQNLYSGILNINSYSETYINGKIKAKENEIVFSTISYDEGIKVYVDNKRAKTYKVADSFLGFDITKGEHSIVIKYVPKGLFSGIIVSLSSLFIILIYIAIKIKKQNKYTKSKFNV